MASPEKLAPALPETLPEDFFDWDSEGSAAPAKSDEREVWEAALAFSETAKPQRQSADREPFSEPPVDRLRVSGSAWSAPVLVKQQKDFVDRKGEATPAAMPRNSWEREAWEAALALGKTQKTAGPAVELEAIVPPVAKRPRVANSASSAPSTRRQQEPASELADALPGPAARRVEASQTASEAAVTARGQNGAATEGISGSPEFQVALRREADEVIFQLFSPKNSEALEEPKTARKKWMIVAPVSAGAVLLLLLGLMPLFHHGAKAVSKPAMQAAPAMSDPAPQTDTAKPPARGRLSEDQAPVTTRDQQSTVDPPANDENAVNWAEAQSKSMNSQISAPTRIPKQVASNDPPPPSFSPAGADGLGSGSGNGGLFKEHAQPVIRVLKPVLISSGVATGMLIRKTEPVYPSIAKAARVSGTVILHAIISKTGTITDVQVVSGPPMLRSAALDAVRTWRYKPYQLNNEPTEIETTINVIFSLAN